MPRRVKLLGGPVDLVRRGDVMVFVAEAVALERKAIVGNQNLHSLHISQQDPKMSAFFAASDLIEIDSMPLIFWGRLMGLRLSRQHRCTYLDWRDQFWRLASDRAWRVFCLGAEAHVNRTAVTALSRAWPGARIEGHHGYFDRACRGAENAAVVEAINQFRPDVILVGMGMPIQESWIIDNYAALGKGVLLSVGAAIDYEAGAQPAAPRVWGDLGLEWLYRFAHEPRRLFRRYMVEPWSLVGAAARDVGAQFAPRSVAPRPSHRHSAHPLIEAAPADAASTEKLRDAA